MEKGKGEMWEEGGEKNFLVYIFKNLKNVHRELKNVCFQITPPKQSFSRNSGTDKTTYTKGFTLTTK